MVAPVLAANPSSTALKDACSAPLHSAITSRCCPDRLLPEPLEPPPPPLLHAAVAAASIATAAMPIVLLWIIKPFPFSRCVVHSWIRCARDAARAYVRTGGLPDRAAVARVEEVHAAGVDQDRGHVA